MECCLNLWDALVTCRFTPVSLVCFSYWQQLPAGTHFGIMSTDVEVKVAHPAGRLLWILARQEVEENVKRVPTDYVEPKVLLPAALNYASLGFFLVGVTSCLSACDRYRWRTIAIVVGFYVQTILELTEWRSLEVVILLTFFSVYEPVAFRPWRRRTRATDGRQLATESKGYIPDLGPLGYDAVLVGWEFGNCCRW